MKKMGLISVIALIIFMSMSERLLAPPYSVVCIDPGHGGFQSGTVGRVYGVLKKDANLGVGLAAYEWGCLKAVDKCV